MSMILEYHRPQELEEALQLLSREMPRTVPLGGGALATRKQDESFAVVDLQDVGLDFINRIDHTVEIGAMTRMSAIAEMPDLPIMLRDTLLAEFSGNLRQMATLGGVVVATDGRSAFLTGLLALDSHLTWLPGKTEISLGNYLPIRKMWSGGKLIQKVSIPTNGKLAIEVVARAPVDRPILVVAVCKWPSGRTRVALGGCGAAPVLAMDGPELAGADLAARNAYLHANDVWASAEYRSEVAMELTRKLARSLAES
jgi:CO/xanthine dehydrogenase FAD-binding subunit